MYTKIKILWLVGTLFFFHPVRSQERLDGAWSKTLIKDRAVLPYPPVSEGDVMWSKRIWRIIDVREKRNLPFQFPVMPLATIIHDAAKSGRLKVYDPSAVDADQFKQVMRLEDINNIGVRHDTSIQIDPVTQQEIAVPVNTPFDATKVIKYRIKEDWFFDKNTSTMQVRIIGIAPVMEGQDQEGNNIGDLTLYWVYFPDLRPILSKYEVFTPGNNSSRMSWDDLFEMRLFESYIYKESNVYDRAISEYATGPDARLESDRIQNNLFSFEQDLWDY